MISPLLVLSSFHCGLEYDLGNTTVRYKDSNFCAYLGAHKLFKGKSVVRKIKSARFPPGPEMKEKGFSGHDLIMFILDKKVSSTTSIHPICLPSPKTELNGKVLTVAGWGETEKKKFSKVMKKLQLVCCGKKGYGKRTLGIITKEKDGIPQLSCKGDSGKRLKVLKRFQKR